MKSTTLNKMFKKNIDHLVTNTIAITTQDNAK